MITSILGVSYALVFLLTLRATTSGQRPFAALPLLAYTGSWAVAFASYTVLTGVYPPLSTHTQIFFSAALVAVVAGTISAGFARPQKTPLSPLVGQRSALLAASFSAGCAFVLCVLYTQQFSTGGLLGILSNDASSSRINRLLQTADEPSTAYSLAELGFYSGLAPLFVTQLQFAANRRRVAIITIGASSLVAIVTASRASLLIFATFFALAVLIRLGVAEILRKLVRPKAIAAFLAIFFFASFVATTRDTGVETTTTYLRANCDSCAVDYVPADSILVALVYPTSSISNFDESINSRAAATSPPLGFGVNTFYGAISPLSRAGLVLPPSIYDEFRFSTSANDQIFLGNALFNTYGAVDDLVRDFGTFGAIVSLFILFVAGTSASSRAHPARPMMSFLASAFIFWCLVSPITNFFGVPGKAVVAGVIGLFVLRMTASRSNGTTPETNRQDEGGLRLGRGAGRR